MWGRCKFHNQADTEGYKPKTKSHCEKWKVTVSVSLEKRDLEAGEKQEALKKRKVLTQTSIVANTYIQLFLLTKYFQKC